jgi:hypothetical protein
MRVTPRQREAAADMILELEGTRLQVAKIPSGDGYIRVVLQENPRWYCKLCAEHLSVRRRFPRPRPFIKRRDTLNALRRISEGHANPGGAYFERLMPLVRKRALELRRRPVVELAPAMEAVYDW